MGRKIAFSYDRAIEEATKLFWQKGYSNTSLRELLRVMRIGESSFYNCIKSKKHLYLECLKHYNDTVSRRRLLALQSKHTARESLQAFFKMVLDELDDPKTPRVCLMAGSLSDDVLEEQELQSHVITEMELFIENFVQCFEHAKETGELPKTFNSEIAAQTLVTYLQGLFRTIRVLHGRIEIEKQIETLLTGLEINEKNF
jgi:TetR/AcrR family transcriptional repressor of nem operon